MSKSKISQRLYNNTSDILRFLVYNIIVKSDMSFLMLIMCKNQRASEGSENSLSY